MQGLSDGYFVLPYTIGNGLAPLLGKAMPGIDHPEFKAAEETARERYNAYLAINGTKSPDYFHRELGKIIWDYCGMARNAEGLTSAINRVQALRHEFWNNVNVPGSGEDLNQQLEIAGRVADFLELGELMCRDALNRNESCGGHFREEYQTEEGEAMRDDENFQYAAAWEYTGQDTEPLLHKEALEFKYVHPAQRSYK